MYHLNVSQWKVLIVDEQSRKLIDNVVREDDILEERVMSTQIEASFKFHHRLIIA